MYVSLHGPPIPLLLLVAETRLTLTHDHATEDAARS